MYIIDFWFQFDANNIEFRLCFTALINSCLKYVDLKLNHG